MFGFICFEYFSLNNILFVYKGSFNLKCILKIEKKIFFFFFLNLLKSLQKSLHEKYGEQKKK